MDRIEFNLHNKIDSFDLTNKSGNNLTLFLSETFENNRKNRLEAAGGSDFVSASELDPDYEQFLADVWVGIVLTLMVLSCVCCMCSCLLYHKFQQWKRNVIDSRNAANLECGDAEAELPSYTIASGLPSYQEALEQLKKVKELTKGVVVVDEKGNASAAAGTTNWVPRTPPTPLSAVNLFHNLYKKQEDSDSNKPA